MAKDDFDDLQLKRIERLIGIIQATLSVAEALLIELLTELETAKKEKPN